MKNLIKFFMVLVVWCVVAACSQTTEGKQEVTKGRLVMNVKSESRTIMPEINENDIKSATLTVNGEEIGSWSDSGIIEQIENTEDILLDTGVYDFEMTFYNENGDVILKGVIEKLEIVAGDNSLVFDMKLVQGKGNIAIELTWEADDGISKIKAGLYHIATGEAVTGYEAEEITINGTQAEYAKNDVPAGQYIIKFEVYDISDKLLNTLTDVIKVIGGKTTSDQKVLSKINTQYTIKYNLDGGSWKSGFTPVTVRNANTGINLPTADNIERATYDFMGWYKKGKKVTEIAIGTAEDVVLNAKWKEGAIGDIVYSDGSVSENYDSTKKPIGIVIEVSAKGVATKIVSLTETSTQWSTQCVTTEATSTTDGKANMTAIQSIRSWGEKYPAFKWCDDYTDASRNSEWYLPAQYELNQLYKVKDYVNATIDKIIAGGGTATKLNGYIYWSSSHFNYDLAWGQRFSDGYQLYNDKNNTNSVRAVRAF